MGMRAARASASAVRSEMATGWERRGVIAAGACGMTVTRGTAGAAGGGTLAAEMRSAAPVKRRDPTASRCAARRRSKAVTGLALLVLLAKGSPITPVISVHDWESGN